MTVPDWLDFKENERSAMTSQERDEFKITIQQPQAQISEERVLALLFPDGCFRAVSGDDQGAVV